MFKWLLRFVTNHITKNLCLHAVNTILTQLWQTAILLGLRHHHDSLESQNDGQHGWQFLSSLHPHFLFSLGLWQHCLYLYCIVPGKVTWISLSIPSPEALEDFVELVPSIFPSQFNVVDWFLLLQTTPPLFLTLSDWLSQPFSVYINFIRWW